MRNTEMKSVIMFFVMLLEVWFMIAMQLNTLSPSSLVSEVRYAIMSVNE